MTLGRGSEGKLCTLLDSFFAQGLPFFKEMCDIAEAFYPTQEPEMTERKLKIIENMEAKSMSVAEAAEAISFDPMILGLYLVKDAYPVPKRILDKVEGTLAS